MFAGYEKLFLFLYYGSFFNNFSFPWSVFVDHADPRWIENGIGDETIPKT